MHTIDLLRGQGIPAKTTLGSVAMIVVIIAVPILAAAGMTDRYLQNKIEIEKKQQAIEHEQQTIEEFADALRFKETAEKNQRAINLKLLEVSSCVGRYIQWTPILQTLVEHMPVHMVMSELSADSKSEQKNVASGVDSNSSNSITIITRKLVVVITGTEYRDYGDDVKNYSELLKSPSSLGPMLQDIVVSQNRGRTGDGNIVSYTMNLIFKPETL